MIQLIKAVTVASMLQIQIEIKWYENDFVKLAKIHHNFNLTEIKKQQKLHPAINAYKTKSIQNPFDAIVLKYKGTSVLKPLISFIYEAVIWLHLLFEACSH